MRLKIVCFFSIIVATVAAEKKSPFQFGGNYAADVFHNFGGGIKTGTAYLGLVNLNVDFDTQKAGWWENGDFHINMANTHGGRPSRDFVGDLQGLSNIEADSHTWLYELWYSQSFGKVSFTIGLQDLNSIFANCESAGLFSNSSFGIQSVFATNFSSPIYPYSALGLNFNWQISDDVLFYTSVFDGQPDTFDKNSFFVLPELNKEGGYFVISELGVNKSLIPGLQACYEFGTYYLRQVRSEDKNYYNYGLFFEGEQNLTDKLSVFAQVGMSPGWINENNQYYGFGFNYKALLPKRKDDILGMAIASAGFENGYRPNETAVELTYLFQIYDNIFIRPDFQYIIHPSGLQTKLNNAFVGMIRLNVGF